MAKSRVRIRGIRVSDFNASDLDNWSIKQFEAFGLTDKQREAFKKLWWIFGNNGPKCTLFNHKLVQGFYQYDENRIEAYTKGRKNLEEKFGKEYANRNGVTDECINACLEIIKNRIKYR